MLDHARAPGKARESQKETARSAHLAVEATVPRQRQLRQRLRPFSPDEHAAAARSSEIREKLSGGFAVAMRRRGRRLIEDRQTATREPVTELNVLAIVNPFVESARPQGLLAGN